MSTKQILTESIDKLDQTILHPRYKELCRDYVSGMTLEELCSKYNIKRSRVHYMLRYSAMALSDILQ